MERLSASAVCMASPPPPVSAVRRVPCPLAFLRCRWHEPPEATVPAARRAVEYSTPRCRLAPRCRRVQPWPRREWRFAPQPEEGRLVVASAPPARRGRGPEWCVSAHRAANRNAKRLPVLRTANKTAANRPPLPDKPVAGPCLLHVKPISPRPLLAECPSERDRERDRF